MGLCPDLVHAQGVGLAGHNITGGVQSSGSERELPFGLSGIPKPDIAGYGFDTIGLVLFLCP